MSVYIWSTFVVVFLFLIVVFSYFDSRTYKIRYYKDPKPKPVTESQIKVKTQPWNISFSDIMSPDFYYV